MTVRQMIQTLVNYPMDYLVVDTEGSPIMYATFARPEGIIKLEPKSEIDTREWLNDFFEVAMNENQNDIDTVEDLINAGFTLNDLKEYEQGVYEWALNYKEYWENRL